MVPESLFYTKEHEWVRVDGSEGTIGITHHAQQELGDIVFVELPAPGRTLRAGEEFGSVESVKAVAEVFAPVSGEVIAVNRAIADNPDRAAAVNQDPYGEGWLIRVRLSAPQELSALMGPEQYREFVAEAAH